MYNNNNNKKTNQCIKFELKHVRVTFIFPWFKVFEASLVLRK